MDWNGATGVAGQPGDNNYIIQTGNKPIINFFIHCGYLICG